MLEHLYSSRNRTVPLLSVCVFLPVAKAKRILLKKGIVGLAYFCDVSLQGKLGG